MAVPKKLQVLGTIKGEPGRDGATFKPAIDEEGNLSWTNDQDLENPLTVNLKGPKGEPGDQYELTDDDVQRIIDELTAGGVGSNNVVDF